MPVHIRELVIRTKITEGAPKPSGAAASEGQATEDVVRAAAEQVLAMIKDQNER